MRLVADPVGMGRASGMVATATWLPEGSMGRASPERARPFRFRTPRSRPRGVQGWRPRPRRRKKNTAANPRWRGWAATRIGNGARRAQAAAIVTRTGRDPEGGLGSPQATRARCRRQPPERNPHRLSDPARNRRAALQTREYPRPGALAAGQGAGGLRGCRGTARQRRRDGAEGGASPPAPRDQRMIASAASRVRARRSRAPCRPLTRLRRGTAVAGGSARRRRPPSPP